MPGIAIADQSAFCLGFGLLDGSAARTVCALCEAKQDCATLLAMKLTWISWAARFLTLHRDEASATPAFEHYAYKNVTAETAMERCLSSNVVTPS